MLIKIKGDKNMNPKQKSLGDRMKEYENVTNTYLIHRMPIMVRIDGRAFHTFCKGMKKPYDDVFIELMNEVTKYLLDSVTDCEIAYVESDEITLCLFPYKTYTTTPFFDGRIQKLCSILSAMATWKFNQILSEWKQSVPFKVEEWMEKSLKKEFAEKFSDRVAMFDCRVWNLPREEVLNCLLWRQQDSKRNAILTAGQTWIGKKQIHALKTTEIIDKLKEMGIDYWEKIPKYYHYGRTFIHNSLKTDWVFDNDNDRNELTKLVNIDEIYEDL